MSATDNLKEEHQVILRMTKILKAASERLEAGEQMDIDVFKKAVEFIQTFADRCHHGKEQDTLFPLLGQRGIPTIGGPIAVMLMEHEQGRRYVKGLSEASNTYTPDDKTTHIAITQNAQGYAELLEQHIYKEDNILYPMGNRVLTPNDNQQLLEKFQKIENNIIGKGKHDHYLNMINELEKELDIS